MSGEFMAPFLKRVGSLVGEQQGKDTETHCNLRVTACAVKCVVQSITPKHPREMNVGRAINYTKMPLHQDTVSELVV